MRKFFYIFLFILTWMNSYSFKNNLGKRRFKEIRKEVIQEQKTEVKEKRKMDAGVEQNPVEKTELYKKRREMNESLVEMAFRVKDAERESEKFEEALKLVKERVEFVEEEEQELLKHDKELVSLFKIKEDDVKRNDDEFINKKLDASLKKIEEKQGEIDQINKSLNEKTYQYHWLRFMERKLQ